MPGRLTVGFSGVRGNSLEPGEHSIYIYPSHSLQLRKILRGRGKSSFALLLRLHSPVEPYFSPCLSRGVGPEMSASVPRHCPARARRSLLCWSACLNLSCGLSPTVLCHSRGDGRAPAPSMVVSCSGTPGVRHAGPH